MTLAFDGLPKLARIRGLRRRVRSVVVRVSCGAALALLGQGAVLAADITVLSVAAVQAPLTELAAQFEKATGNHVRPLSRPDPGRC